MQGNPYQQYRKVQVETSSPLGLIVQLYDGALRFIGQAQQGIEEKNYELVNNSIQRVQAIVDELNISLNMEVGEISENLQQLYLFVGQTLLQANLKKDGKLLDDVVNILAPLRDSWVEVERTQKVKAVSTG